MKQEQAHIDQIRTAFEKMQSREDLLHVLNEAKPLVYGDKAVPFELKQLTWYANPKLGRKRYAEFKIKKKSGAERCIHAPVKGLKSLQKTLSFVLQCVYEPHNAAMGFVRDRSIVDNAKLHVGSKYVYNIDLKDFFPSVDQARVWKCFQLKPFNLNKASSVEPQYMKWEDFKKEHLKTEEPITFLKGKGRMFTNTPCGTLYVANNFDKEKDKYILLGSSSLKTKAGKSLEGTLWLVNKIPDTSRLDIANIIASLCCTEMEVERKTETGEWEKVKRNVLPQGAPTSPVITNIVCQRLDYLLSGVAKRFGLKYSRYADDITFSSMHNVYQTESDFLKELHRIIAEQNFHIKESKTRLQKDGYRKEVTGLLVNEKVNVQQRYIKQLRMWLYYWERYGYERAYSYFLTQYISDKGHVKNGKPDMANVISGKLDYLKMVKGADNELYLKLKSRFDLLIGFEDPINQVLNVWETDGIEIAMDFYYKDKLEQMAKTKYDFIKELLENKKINQNDRERILELASREISLEGTLEERVQKIEEIIFKENQPETTLVNSDNLSINVSKTLKYLDPCHLYNFLFEYNQNPILRTTCHDIDANELKSILEFCKIESYNFNEHLKLIVTAYEEHEKAYKAPFQVKALIRGYLTGKDYKGKIIGWSSNNIKINWSSVDLSIWANDNSNIPPNSSNILLREKKVKSYKIEPQIKSPITEVVIQTFNQLVLHFKNLFHLKSGPQSLKEIIQRVNSEKGWSDKVVFEIDNNEFSNNLEHFVDVEKLMQAYNKIIELIIEQHKFNEKPKVKLKYYEVNHKVFFSIHHLNGVYNKTIKNTIERLGQTYTSLIKNQINGLCNLRMKADFGNEKYAEINLWDGLDRTPTQIYHFEGVEHFLEFPKIF